MFHIFAKVFFILEKRILYLLFFYLLFFYLLFFVIYFRKKELMYVKLMLIAFGFCFCDMKKEATKMIQTI